MEPIKRFTGILFPSMITTEKEKALEFTAPILLDNGRVIQWRIWFPRSVWEKAPWYWANHNKPEDKKLWGKKITPWHVANVFGRTLPHGAIRIARKSDILKAEKEGQDRACLL